MIKQVSLSVAGILAVALLGSIGCSKNQDPVHDTIYAPKPDTTVNLTKGLLVYLPFSGSIADSSGNNNPTKAVGTVLTYDAHGFANNAFGATGNGEKVYVTNNGSIKFDTAFSISFGFMTNANNTATYISMVNPVNGYSPSFIIGTTFPTIKYLDMGIGDSSVGCSSYGQIDNKSIADTTNFLPVPGAWYNLIAIYHHGGIKIYINGSLIASKDGIGTKAVLCPNSQIIIGAWWDSDPQSFNGKMDNFRLYNRVLTPHEIVALSSSYQVTSNSVRQIISR
ncbi:MAG: LamG domain-containing protein [Bacteroidetes bacterium]|nr:LamG domain-containing protein [Bacteroidota bacterium]